MTGRILISPESTSQTTTVRGRTMTLTGPALDVAMILALLGVGALSFGPAFGRPPVALTRVRHVQPARTCFDAGRA